MLCDGCLWKGRCDEKPTTKKHCLYFYTEATGENVVEDYIEEERAGSLAAFFRYIDLFYNEEDGDYHI